MSNANSYRPFNAAAADAPAVVSVLANKLLAKKECLDGHERFGDVEAAVLGAVESRGDFNILIYAEGSSQVDVGSTERANMPVAAVLAEAVIAEFAKLPKGAQARILERFTAGCAAVRAADAADATVPVKSNDKLISLAETVAPEIAALTKDKLKPRQKAPAVRTAGTAYILSAELCGVRVDDAVSPGNQVLGTVADLVAGDREVAKELNVSVATARKIARQVKAARTASGG